jgi:hypothetical protein
VVQVSSKYEVPSRNSIKFPSISNPRSFPEFSFKINFESEDVSIEKVVPLFKQFKTTFSSKFFDLGKVLFGSNKV